MVPSPNSHHSFGFTFKTFLTIMVNEKTKSAALANNTNVIHRQMITVLRPDFHIWNSNPVGTPKIWTKCDHMNSTRSHAICADNWWNRLHDSTSFHVEGTNDVDSNISPLKSDNTTRCTTPMHCKLHVFNRPLFIESDQNINVSMGSITKSYKYYHKNVGFLPSEYWPGRKSTNDNQTVRPSIGNTPSLANSCESTVICAKKEVLSLR